MAQRRNLTSGSGGVGTASAQIVISGSYTSGDPFSAMSDLFYFSNAVLERRTIDLEATTVLDIAIPTGARAVLIQAPYGNTTAWDVTDTSGSYVWAVNPDGAFFSTLPSAMSTPGHMYLYAAAAITGMLITFV